MIKFLKITGILLIILIITSTIGIYYIVNHIDPNRFKTKINARVAELTHRQLTIGGDLSWSLFPATFEANDLVLSNTKDFAATPFLQIGKVHVSVRLLPLLFGNIEIRSIVLDNVQINLQQHANGSANWQNFEPIQTSETANNLAFNISSLTIIHGTINYQDEQKANKWQLKNVYFHSENIGTEQVFPITSTFDLIPPQNSQAIKFHLSANCNINNNLDDFAINELELKTNNLDLSANIASHIAPGQFSYQGNIVLPTTNLRDILTSFGWQLPELHNPKALTEFSTQFAFEGDNNSIDINPFEMKIDQTDFTGSMHMEPLTKPQLQFKLNAAQLNLDDYLPLANTTSSSNTSASEDLPLQLLQKLNLHGNFVVSQLTAARLHLNNASFLLSAQEGVWQINPFTADLYEGNITANAAVNFSSAVPVYTANAQLKTIQTSPLFNDILNHNIVTGPADITINLSSEGKTTDELVNQLNGKVQLTMATGSVPEIDIRQLLTEANALITKAVAPTSTPSASNFDQASGIIDIKNGIAYFNNFSVKSTDFLSMLNGSANFDTQKINLVIMTKTTLYPNLKPYSIPITLQGDLASPIISLDEANLLRQIKPAKR